MIRRWLDNLRAAWRRFVTRHIVADAPSETPRERLPTHALFVVDGNVFDLEGLRAWAHGQMYPRSVRRQTWN